jgi:hypothetical protein
MRILILCLATFGSGLVAGSVLWPDSSGGERVRTRSGAESERGYRAGDYDGERSDGSGGAARRVSDGRDSSGAPRADVSALTRAASQNLENIMSGGDDAEYATAEGIITGTVRDPSGNPVSGVTITAIPVSRPMALSAPGRQARQRPHENRDFRTVAQSAIQGELWRRNARRSATSGSNGRFEIIGLEEVNHTLTAFHEQYEVVTLNQRARTQPGAVIDFVARPITLVRIKVLMPEGELADNAWVNWQGPHGNGGEAWLKSAGMLRLPIGACKVKATTTLPMPMESELVERTIVAGASAEPLVLQLKGRKILTARLTMPEGFSLPGRVEYRLRLMEGAAIEPEELLKDQSQRLARTPSPGVAHWLDLEPGRYLIAAFLDRRRLLGSAIAEVGEGPAEVAIPVEEPDPSSFVKVKLIGPDGGPVPGNVSFRVITGAENRPKTAKVDAMQRDEGWIVFLDRIDRKSGEDASMRVGTRDFGGAVEKFNLRGGGTITFRFNKPAKLKVQLGSYNGSGVEGSLFVALRGKLGADAWRLVSPDGSVAMTGVQPGEYHLQFYIRRKGKNWPIFKRAMNLRAGEDEVDLNVPPLHTLAVRWGGKGRPNSVQIRCNDERIGWLRRDARFRGKKASFDLLAPGAYELRVGKKRFKVNVPGPAEKVLQ